VEHVELSSGVFASEQQNGLLAARVIFQESRHIQHLDNEW